MRLIDADAAIAYIKAVYCADCNSNNGVICRGCSYADAILATPTIDAEPVRHGELGSPEIVGYDGVHAVYAVPCSACGRYTELHYARFCPNCGARMDAKEVNHG